MTEPKDLWTSICERAGIERDEEAVGYPAHIAQTFAFAWLPSVDQSKPTVFEVGKSCPLSSKVTYLVAAIFRDESEVRVYGLPESKSDKPEDMAPKRWVLSKTSPTMTVDRFIDPEAFLDCLAAEVLLYEAELEDLLEETPEETAPANGQVATQAQPG